MAKELTVQQQTFLDVLFGPEARGDLKTAMELAGYTNPNVSYIVAHLKDEIIQRAKDVLALNAPKAVLAMVGLLDGDPPVGANIRMKAAMEVLDRCNVVKQEHISIGVEGGVFLLPAKEIIDGKFKVVEQTLLK